MTRAARKRPGWALHLLTVLGLAYLALPDRAAAAAHTIYGRLDGADLALAQAVVQETLESRRSEDLRLWRNEASGNSGSVQPLRTFKIESGHFCREYRETVVAGQRLESQLATACRTRNGVWLPVEP